MPIDPFDLGWFVPIFAVVRAMPGVTMADALCYGVLATYRGKGPGGECRPSMARLARDLGTDERDTRRRVQKLERLGLIERVERPGKPCIINFLQPRNPGVKDPGVTTPGVNLPGVDDPAPPRGERPRGPRGLRPLQVDPKEIPSVDPNARAVFDRWVSVMGKRDAKFTKSRRAKIGARLRDGYTVDQLCAAIDGCRRSAFHMGENDRQTAYNDLATILKSGEAVEQHIERAHDRSAPAQALTNGIDAYRERVAREVPLEH